MRISSLVEASGASKAVGAVGAMEGVCERDAESEMDLEATEPATEKRVGSYEF
jgi:hypothetical protein